MKTRKKKAYSAAVRRQAATNIAARASGLSPEKVSSRKGCLDTAAAAVLGDRALNYGSAEDNFGRIAHLMNAYLEVRKGGGQFAAERVNAWAAITPHDVAMLSIMTKIARLANTPAHADSWADIAGYAACGAEINKAEY